MPLAIASRRNTAKIIYLLSRAVMQRKKSKGRKEAHEAIRPAGNQFVDPDETGLTGTQFRLYDLIWKRTIASQMVDARQKQVSAKIQVGDALFGASGMTIEFPVSCAPMWKAVMIQKQI